MTFGKDQDPKLAGSKGGKTKSDLRNLRVSLSLKKKWLDPDFKKKHYQRIKKYSFKTKEEFSEMGKRSRFFENLIAEKIRNEYDFLFYPNEICDRIGVKKDKIFFIEIKNPKDKTLTDKQRLFKKIAGEYFILQ